VPTRRNDRAGGGESIHRDTSAGVFDRPEHRRRAAIDRDDEPLTAGGAPQLRRQVLAQLASPDPLIRHVYASVHTRG
jgi:hypothetical protein